MKKLDVLAIFGIAILVGVIAGLGISISSYVRIGHLQKMYDAAITAQSDANHAADIAAAKLAAEEQEARRQASVRQQADLRLGIVHRGEGIETAFIRQFVADPSLCDGSKTCRPFSGNPNDLAALKRWAGSAAHILACKAGYADCKYGAADIRVATPDTMAYVIERTLTGIQVTERRVNAPSSKSISIGGEKTITSVSAPIGTQHATTTIAASRFLGMPDIVNKLPNYEYRHIG